MSMPGNGSTAPAGAPVASTAVKIQNFKFDAPSIRVKVGATVTWTNGDEDPHTVTAISGPFHSPTLGNGAKFSYTFTGAGTFTYMCTIHPFMHGTVVVTG
jgi:amicyanin